MLSNCPFPPAAVRATTEAMSKLPLKVLCAPKCKAKYYQGEPCPGKQTKIGYHKYGDECDNLGHVVLRLWPTARGLLATQPESRLNESRVAEYMAQMEHAIGSCSPTVLCYQPQGGFKERLLVLDGHHKLEAARRLRNKRKDEERRPAPRLNFLIIHTNHSDITEIAQPTEGTWGERWRQIESHQRAMRALDVSWRSLAACGWKPEAAGGATA